MIYTPLTKCAMAIAEEAHRGQTDKSGFPYLHHPLHLADAMTDQYSCAAALLHDVVEDTELTLDDLRNKGIPEEVIEAIDLLTHKDGVPYMDYVKSIGENRIAIKVKLADLEHNLNENRLMGNGESPKKETYLAARDYLLSKREKGITEIVLASSNQGKKKEYEELLGPLGIRIFSPEDVGFYGDIEEYGTTYRANAYIKAKALSHASRLPVIADDSGLEIASLGGEPGLHTARFARQYGGYSKAWKEIFKRLAGKDRSAKFMCSICFLAPEGEPQYFDGVCPGWILEEPKGDYGFGYDPIFHCLEGDIDFGEAPDEVKNLYSHRGKASRKLQAYLRSLR